MEGLKSMSWQYMKRYVNVLYLCVLEIPKTFGIGEQHSTRKSHLKQMKAKEFSCSKLFILVPVVHIFNGNNPLV